MMHSVAAPQIVGLNLATIGPGLVLGLTYALLGTGLVLVYRATRVINFAYGQIGAIAATMLAKAVLDWHWNFFLALPVFALLGAAIGAVVEITVVRRLFNAARLQLFVATLGISQVLLVVQYLLPKVKASSQGGSLEFPSPLSWVWTVDHWRITSPSFMVLLVVPVAVLGVGAFLKGTWAGLFIRGCADNADMAHLSGVSPKRVSTMVWMISGGLAALTAVLLIPAAGMPLNAPVNTVGAGFLLPALAAALVGGLRSFPLTLLGGAVIGVLQVLLQANLPTTPGVADLFLFLTILVLVLTRRLGAGIEGGQWALAARVPVRPAGLERVWWARRLPVITSGGAVLTAGILPFFFSEAGRIFTFTTVVLTAMVGLSVTVLTGWSGQLSLSQASFMGVGAVTTAAMSSQGYSFTVAVLAAVVLGSACAVIVGIPALRISGLFLAVTTMAFAVAAQSWLFHLSFLDRAAGVFKVNRPVLFGVDLHSQRSYYYFCLTALTLVALAVSHLRRTGIGCLLVATRDNERCAESFGTSPMVVKLSAFAFAGAVAALAGALWAGLQGYFTVSAGQVPPFSSGASLSLIAMAVIGGLGSVSGTMIGALYVAGLPVLFTNSPVVALGTSGVGLLFLLLYVPGGLVTIGYRLQNALFRLALRNSQEVTDVAGQRASHAAKELPARQVRDRELPADVPALEVANVNVQFGGLQALSDVSIVVPQGEIVGLIGSNGAGKSTLMNVISGFQTTKGGHVELWGEDITSEAPYMRARLGVGRIFQDARLFGDLTVRETVKVAMEVHERSEFIPSLLGYPPSRRVERSRAAAADQLIDFLGLGRYADTFLSDLSTGTRRIVELCCLIARESKLLLLDEPTAGVAQRETEAFAPIIQRIRQELDATVVIIEHDMPLVMSISDRVYCMDAGRVIAEGDPVSVRNDPSVIAAYLGTDERAIQRSGAVSAPSPLDAQGSSPSARKSRPRRPSAAVGGAPQPSSPVR